MSDGADAGAPPPAGVLPPRPVLAAAILLVGGLGWSVAAAPPQVAGLAEAARWEGQAVALEGWATEVRDDAAGTRFRLVDGPHAVPVRLAAAPDPPLLPGDRVRVEGRLTRWQGQLRLDAEDAGSIRVLPGPRPLAPAWSDLAERPAAWEGRLVVLRGEVAGGRLADGPHSVALGEGPWPPAGPVQARGLLRDDPACLCRRLDAREVWAWTS